MHCEKNRLFPSIYSDFLFPKGKVTYKKFALLPKYF